MKHPGLLLSILVLVLTIPSCRKARSRVSLARFYGKEVTIPKMPQFVMGEDSVVVDLDTIPLLTVVYRDSKACVPCMIEHMFEYEPLIETCGWPEDKRCFPVFLFSPAKKREESVRYNLSRTRFGFPVFIDDGSFAEQNRSIPSEQGFHVFLLDKNRKVVLIGDPSHNPALMNLYEKTIDTLLARGGVL